MRIENSVRLAPEWNTTIIILVTYLPCWSISLLLNVPDYNLYGPPWVESLFVPDYTAVIKYLLNGKRDTDHVRSLIQFLYTFRLNFTSLKATWNFMSFVICFILIATAFENTKWRANISQRTLKTNVGKCVSVKKIIGRIDFGFW